MLTLETYWMGRNLTHSRDLTHEIIQNAHITVDKINALIADFEFDTDLELDTWASGWRPPSVNGSTPNAATGSKHLTARAGDVHDTPGRDFARWCLRNLDRLEAVGLWMEDPQWTPTWVHLQIVPPGSGRRVYVPSSAPAMVAKLPEQGGVVA